MIKMERQPRLVSTAERTLVAVGQPQPGLVQPVAPFEDESLEKEWIKGGETLGRPPVRRPEKRPALLEQFRLGPVAREKLDQCDAGERVGNQALVGRLSG